MDVSNNDIGQEGGKSLADCLKTNTTITQVRYSDSSEGITRCISRRANVTLRACSGRERREQPRTKLFAKLAVEVFALNLIRLFVVVCGHVVSLLRVC